MKFISTRTKDDIVSFQKAVFTGLAPDGGLYHPVSTPNLRPLFDSFNDRTQFQSLAADVTAALFPEEISKEAAERICRKAFTFCPKLKRIDEDISILELFHGPSCAFKDFGASFLATVMEEFLQEKKKRAIILTATSGDTGSAVARAFHRKKQIDVVVLYPSGRVSPLQEKQLTTVGDNVVALEVKGSFDDCQKMVKEAFVDAELRKRLPLTSANSINLGRLLPQSFYYIYGHSLLKDRFPDITFVVPSGNFGNLTSGVLAWTWGLPIKRFVAATNINDVVPEYLQTGSYNPRPSKRTYSNAMDVGAPSNFERLQEIFHHQWGEMKSIIDERVVTDEQTLETIRKVWITKNFFLDPHTAVGYSAAGHIDTRGEHLIILATAHPGKFLEVVEEATGEKVPLPEQLSSVLSRTKESIVIENSDRSLRDLLIKLYD